MEDREIIGLYFARNEQAISETDLKYGALCRSLAMNILGIPEDAEECVSDTYHKTWLSIPPQWPANFRAFLAKITRNLSISRWRKLSAQKRGGAGADLLISELGECLHDPKGDPADAMEIQELSRSIDAWLRSLKEEDRYIFVRRYWYGEAVGDIEKALGTGNCAQKLHRLRLRLRSHLEKEGFAI